MQYKILYIPTSEYYVSLNLQNHYTLGVQRKTNCFTSAAHTLEDTPRPLPVPHVVLIEVYLPLWVVLL